MSCGGKTRRPCGPGAPGGIERLARFHGRNAPGGPPAALRAPGRLAAPAAAALLLFASACGGGGGGGGGSGAAAVAPGGGGGAVVPQVGGPPPAPDPIQPPEDGDGGGGNPSKTGDGGETLKKTSPPDPASPASTGALPDCAAGRGGPLLDCLDKGPSDSDPPPGTITNAHRQLRVSRPSWAAAAQNAGDPAADPTRWRIVHRPREATDWRGAGALSSAPDETFGLLDMAEWGALDPGAAAALYRRDPLGAPSLYPSDINPEHPAYPDYASDIERPLVTARSLATAAEREVGTAGQVRPGETLGFIPALSTLFRATPDRGDGRPFGDDERNGSLEFEKLGGITAEDLRKGAWLVVPTGHAAPGGSGADASPVAGPFKDFAAGAKRKARFIYGLAPGGTARHRRSHGCEGIEDYCLGLPFTVRIHSDADAAGRGGSDPGVGAGTHYSAALGFISMQAAWELASASAGPGDIFALADACAVDIGADGPDAATGRGRLDLGCMLEAARAHGRSGGAGWGRFNPGTPNKPEATTGASWSEARLLRCQKDHRTEGVLTTAEFCIARMGFGIPQQYDNRHGRESFFAFAGSGKDGAVSRFVRWRPHASESQALAQTIQNNGLTLQAAETARLYRRTLGRERDQAKGPLGAVRPVGSEAHAPSKTMFAWIPALSPLFSTDPAKGITEADLTDGPALVVPAGEAPEGEKGMAASPLFKAFQPGGYRTAPQRGKVIIVYGLNADLTDRHERSHGCGGHQDGRTITSFSAHCIGVPFEMTLRDFSFSRFRPPASTAWGSYFVFLAMQMAWEHMPDWTTTDHLLDNVRLCGRLVGGGGVSRGLGRLDLGCFARRARNHGLYPLENRIALNRSVDACLANRHRDIPSCLRTAGFPAHILGGGAPDPIHVHRAPAWAAFASAAKTRAVFQPTTGRAFHSPGDAGAALSDRGVVDLAGAEAADAPRIAAFYRRDPDAEAAGATRAARRAAGRVGRGVVGAHSARPPGGSLGFIPALSPVFHADDPALGITEADLYNGDWLILPTGHAAPGGSGSDDSPAAAVFKDFHADAKKRVRFVYGMRDQLDERYENQRGRHERSHGCGGIGSLCIGAPFAFQFNWDLDPADRVAVSGTHWSAALVFLAYQATWESMRPGATVENLFDLGDRCTVAGPRPRGAKNGLGRLDFGCLARNAPLEPAGQSAPGAGAGADAPIDAETQALYDEFIAGLHRRGALGPDVGALRLPGASGLALGFSIPGDSLRGSLRPTVAPRYDPTPHPDATFLPLVGGAPGAPGAEAPAAGLALAPGADGRGEVGIAARSGRLSLAHGLSRRDGFFGGAGSGGFSFGETRLARTTVGWRASPSVRLEAWRARGRAHGTGRLLRSLDGAEEGARVRIARPLESVASGATISLALGARRFAGGEALLRSGAAHAVESSAARLDASVGIRIGAPR